MSKAFNNAFIRAYAKGRGQPAAESTGKPSERDSQSGPHISRPSRLPQTNRTRAVTGQARQDDVGGAEVRQPLSDDERLADDAEVRQIHLVDQGHDVPTPHLTFVETSGVERSDPPSGQRFDGATEGMVACSIVSAGPAPQDAADQISFQWDSLLIIPEVEPAADELATDELAMDEVAEAFRPQGPETAPAGGATGSSQDRDEPVSVHAEGFLPAWEVDRIVWPEVCERLFVVEQECFEQTGSQLRQATEDGLKVLAVSSTIAGEGRTTLALGIARAAAKAGVRVALVDASTRHPDLASTLRFEPESSWHDVLGGDIPLEEAAIAALEDGVTLFPLAETARLNLHDARVSELIGRIAADHDLVILDAPPIGAADAAFFQGGERCPIQAAIIVRDVRRTSHEQSLASVERLRQHGISAVGIAENFGSTT